MGFIIRNSDKKAFNNINYVKNATYWKDLLAFYDAYTLITSRTKNELPNFCFENGQLSLTGICLLIKESMSEFTFSSLNPSIDYLKILYYSMASYSKNGELPHRSSITADYNKYQRACRSALEKSKELTKDNENIVETKNERYKEQTSLISQLKKKVVTGKILLLFAVVLIAVSVAVLFAGEKLLSLDKSKLISIIGFAVGMVALVVGIILIAKFSKAYKTEKGFKPKVIPTKVESTDTLNKEKNVVYKLLSEYYEYRNNLPKTLYDKTPNSFLKLLNSIKMSQQIYDNQNLQTIANNHEFEVKQIIFKLDEKNVNFDEIYSSISKKHWLYYSQLVRYKFISEFSKNAIANHNWLIKNEDENIHPFDIDIKSLINEKISFLSNNNEKVYCMPFEELMKSSALKTLNFKEFATASQPAELRYLKMQYLTRFYDNGYFKNLNEKVYSVDTNSEEYSASNLQKIQKLPALFEIDEKLQTEKLNLENSKDATISTVLQSIENNVYEFSDYNEDVLPKSPIDSEDLLSADDELDDIIEIDEHTAICTFGDKKVVNFKI